MLIPFLDILCSLIGVLILIIVMVSVAQVRKAGGRTREQLQLAQQFQDLKREQRELEKTAAERQQKSAELARKQQELAARQQKLIELRKRLELSAAEETKDKAKATAAQKLVEDLVRQIEALRKQAPPLQAEIAQLQKDLAARQKKPDARPPAIVVRPSGSGAAGRGQRLFFVEASGAGLQILSGGKTNRVARDSIGLDKEYNAFLKTVQETGGASLLFLIRKDGWWSYQRAAGWAEQEFQLKTGKLPLPGDGAVDLSLFAKP